MPEKVPIWSSMETSENPKQRYSRGGVKHTRVKNQAFIAFEQKTGEQATDADFEVSGISNPRIHNINGDEVAVIDVGWQTTTEYLNYFSGNAAGIREQLSPPDQERFDRIMANDVIRKSFEATRNPEDH